MTVDLKFNGMGPNKFKKPYRGDSFKITVAPGGAEIAYLRLLTKTTPTCSIGVSFKWKKEIMKKRSYWYLYEMFSYMSDIH